MKERAGLIYEVTLDVDSEIIAEFDLWLASHVGDMLDLNAFRDAQVLESESGEPGKLRRVVHYFPISEDALQNYFATDASAMRQAGVDRFNHKFSAQRRILKDTELPTGASPPRQNCLNCGVTLTGQYCGNCGQRARSRLISIWQLSREAFGDIFEIDSRVWQTLIPLLLKPGELTSCYLQGKRARYMPPFRMYIVLSVVFFLVAFFDPSEKFGSFYPPAANPPVADQTDQAKQKAAIDAAIAELREEGLKNSDKMSAIIADSPDDLQNTESKSSAKSNVRRIQNELGKIESDTQLKSDCDVSEYDEAPDWVKTALPRNRLIQICERITGDDGKSLLAGLLDNVPAFLIVFLPILALVMKALYPLSKRYYVEHLLFVVHLHAFFFLLLTLQIIFSRVATSLAFPDLVSGLATAGVSIYIPIYLYKGMRKVYGQSRVITIGKFMILSTSYVTGFVVMLTIALLFTAISL